jgi:hypothetical protein
VDQGSVSENFQGVEEHGKAKSNKPRAPRTIRRPTVNA